MYFFQKKLKKQLHFSKKYVIISIAFEKRIFVLVAQLDRVFGYEPKRGGIEQRAPPAED